MAKRKKRRDLGPRRKRMRRPARLQAAVKWKSGYGGKDIVRGYARWFGVDLLCAVVELRMLGVEIDAARERDIRRAIAARAEERARRRAAELAAKARPAEISDHAAATSRVPTRTVVLGGDSMAAAESASPYPTSLNGPWCYRSMPG